MTRASRGLSRAGSTRAWRAVRLAVLVRDGFRCYWCGKTAQHVDHVLPRSRGGTDDPSNLVAACARCNLTRGAGPIRTAPASLRWL